MKDDYLLKTTQVNFRADNRLILENISFELKHGQLTSLIGPNGAGKTSLVKLLIGSIKPSSGKITKRQGLRLGYMPQHLSISRLMPLRTIDFLNLLPVAKTKLDYIIAELKIEPLLYTLLGKLSGGEKQKIFLAQALARDPELLILDEPNQGLDIDSQKWLAGKLREYRETKDMAMLIVSHDLNFVLSNSDLVLCLNRHICCQGKPNELSLGKLTAERFGLDLSQLALYQHHHDHKHSS